MNEILKGILIGTGMAFVALFLAIAISYANVSDTISVTVYTSSSCHWCDKFKEEVLDDYHVQQALKDIRVSILDMYDPSSKENVRAVPAVYFYKNGKKVCYFVGYKDKDEFLKYLWQAINA